MLAVSIMRLVSDAAWADTALFGLSFAATAYVAYLTYIELFVLGAVCPWCVSVAIMSVAIFVIVAWELFRPKLAAVQSLKDAFLLHADTVPPDSPGRRYYSNLGFFLQTFAAPNGANGTELSESIRLLAVFDAEGALKPGVRPALESGLRSVIARHR